MAVDTTFRRSLERTALGFEGSGVFSRMSAVNQLGTLTGTTNPLQCGDAAAFQFIMGSAVTVQLVGAPKSQLFEVYIIAQQDATAGRALTVAATGGTVHGTVPSFSAGTANQYGWINFMTANGGVDWFILGSGGPAA